MHGCGCNFIHGEWDVDCVFVELKRVAIGLSCLSLDGFSCWVGYNSSGSLEKLHVEILVSACGS